MPGDQPPGMNGRQVGGTSLRSERRYRLPHEVRWNEDVKRNPHETEDNESPPSLIKGLLIFTACALSITFVFGLGVAVGKKIALQPQGKDEQRLERSHSRSAGADLLSYPEILHPDAKPAGEESKAPSSRSSTSEIEQSQNNSQNHRPLLLKSVPVRPSAKRNGEPRVSGQSGAPLEKISARLASPREKRAGKAATKEKRRYTLQISTFEDQFEARFFAKRLEKKWGYRAYISRVNISALGHLFSVRLGNFSTKDQAARAKIELERKTGLLSHVAGL